MFRVVVLVPLLAAFPIPAGARSEPRCPEGLTRHEPTQTCMTPETQDYVNCVAAILKAGPLAKFEQSIHDNSDQIEGGVGANLVLRSGGIEAMRKQTQHLLKESGVLNSEEALRLCRPPAASSTTTVNRKPPRQLLGPECAHLEITQPIGGMSESNAIAANLDSLVRWTPEACRVGVQLITDVPSQISIRNARERALRIRLIDPTSQQTLTERWVTTTETRKPSAQLLVATSKSGQGARLIDKTDKEQLVTVGKWQAVEPGEYTLALGPARRFNVSLTAGEALQFHDEVESIALPPPPTPPPPPPPIVELVAPSNGRVKVAIDGDVVAGGSRRALNPAATKTLTVALTDKDLDVAKAQITRAADGGVTLQMEPVARKPSLWPVLLGGAGATVAGGIWALWLRPSAADAQKQYDHLAAGADFTSARDRATSTAARANLILGAALTSLIVGGAIQLWELYREAP